MAVTGRKPKEDGQKVNRNPAVHDWVDVPNVPYKGKKPGLPRSLAWGGGKVPLPAQTRAWWRRVSAMPHCSLWTETDWQFALDTAMVHAAFMYGDTVRAGEVRVREKQMGTTLDARRDLRIRYVDPEPEMVEDGPRIAQVADFAAARKRRLTDAG